MRRLFITVENKLTMKIPSPPYAGKTLNIQIAAYQRRPQTMMGKAPNSVHLMLRRGKRGA